MEEMMFEKVGHMKSHRKKYYMKVAELTVILQNEA